ncbi:hypothetical protein [Pseudoalteromonas peptidolytica]|uniref:Uncharacterized protein n=1 Tax=Pseudoalteromonas peptidolytica F12-50-A1 TaxID=1315280 RepID=A0A8I0N041_9GAMM|nr:hypothetical protein [Pseudoalteromonas peptidolytica]MBE0349115.1 hypothetical protein [Pseudoalteromonas peptidolytica F12-50-A1]NLR17206.1 hypothetical protein [Pseudoalteromonas peptidolytica]GEK11368.1 hypothetical protein PPE03_36170 [Pseudoalteromonas peptidolytica]
MKNINKIAFASVLAITLSACSSTKEPIVFEDFTANSSDSFAKTTMRLAGSNKFMDSADGDAGTREVPGSSVMALGQLLMLDFAGAASTAINDSIIENEPLAKSAQFIVKVDNVDESALANPEGIIARASKKLDEITAKKGLEIESEKTTNTQRIINFKNKNQCKNLLLVLSTCGQYLGLGRVSSYDQESKSAYVTFEAYGKFVSLHLMSDYMGDDVYLYHPRKLNSGNWDYSRAMYAGSHIVIHKGKVHKFITGQKFDDGMDISELRYVFFENWKKDDKSEYNEKYYKNPKDKGKYLYDYHLKDMSFSELPLDTKL